jgi:hypothetical protein
MPWTDEFLDQKRLQADPLADEALGLIVSEKGEGEARRLFDLLIHNIGMPLREFPPLVQDYLEATGRLPAWSDWNKVAMAHDLFLDHGPKFLIFLYYKSLPLLYTCAHGAKVLARTGRLTHDPQDRAIFTRRIAETGQFLLDVMSRKGLQPGGRGIQAIQKVRLIHASIRRFIPQEDWDEAAFGKPINQEDMAVTLMTFSISLIDGLAQFGIEEKEERLEAYLHTWTAIGHALGIDDDLLPANLTEARTLIDKILQRQSKDSEDGRILARALVHFARETFPNNYLDDAPVYLIRHLVGPQRADMLDVQTAYGCLGLAVPLFLRKLFHLGERLEDKVKEPLKVVIEKLSKITTYAMVGYFDQYKKRNFEIPEEMEKVWLKEEKR